MNAPLRAPDPTWEALLAAAAGCLSCHTCRLECAIHVPTGQLPPVRFVRLVGAGLHDELARLPSVWACLQCNRCAAACPRGVEPVALARHLRQHAVASGLVPPDTLNRYEALLAEFHRVRWHLVEACARGADPEAFASDWSRWAATPVPPPAPIRGAPAPRGSRAEIDGWIGYPSGLAACATCRECTTSCPVAVDPTVFDPVAVFRLLNLGRLDDLLVSPTPWLCLGCSACTAACAQGVPGRLVLAAVQDLAIARGAVPADFRERLWAFERVTHQGFLAQIRDLLLP